MIDQSGSDNQIAPSNDADASNDPVGLTYRGHSLEQAGKNNTMNLTQSGMGNKISQARQIGDGNQTDADISGVNNGHNPLTSSSPTYPWSTFPGASGESGAMAGALDQFGDGNTVDLIITGDDNAFGTLQIGNDNLAVNMSVTGNANSIGVGQYGDRNEIDLAIVDGDNNSIGFNQDGDDNFASADVNGDKNNSLIGQDGARNETYLEVNGNMNEASLKVTGDDNYLNAYQKQRRNVMDVDFQGNDNNNYPVSNAFSGMALMARDVVRGSGGSMSASFGQGDLIQIGYGGSGNSRNSLILTGSNADKSSFATYQDGNRNAIVGSISNGDFNQVVVAQIGSDNSASFSQVGNNNNAGIIQ